MHLLEDSLLFGCEQVCMFRDESKQGLVKK